MDQDENFYTPPSSPQRQKRRKVVSSLEEHLMKLKKHSKYVNGDDSFYINDAIDFSYEDDDEDPKHHVCQMVDKIKEIQTTLSNSFEKVSNCYVGKTQDYPQRFLSHLRTKQNNAKNFEALIMVVIAEFDHVPSQDVHRWEMNLDFLGLLYESLLTKELQNQSISLLSEEPAGGGRMRKKMTKNVYLYAMFRVSQFITTINLTE